MFKQAVDYRRTKRPPSIRTNKHFSDDKQKKKQKNCATGQPEKPGCVCVLYKRKAKLMHINTHTHTTQKYTKLQCSVPSRIALLSRDSPE